MSSSASSSDQEAGTSAAPTETLLGHLKTLEISSVKLSRTLLIGIGILCNTFLIANDQNYENTNLFGLLFYLAGPPQSSFEEKMVAIQDLFKAVVSLLRFVTTNESKKRKIKCASPDCNKDPYLASNCFHRNFYCGAHGEGKKRCIHPFCSWTGNSYWQLFAEASDDAENLEISASGLCHLGMDFGDFDFDQFHDDLIAVEVADLQLLEKLEAAVTELANGLKGNLSAEDMATSHPFGIFANLCKNVEEKKAYPALIVKAVLHFKNIVDPMGEEID